MQVESLHSAKFAIDAEPPLSLRKTIVALSPSTQNYVYPLGKTQFVAASCSPPTPVSDLNRYTNDINSLHSAILNVINSTPANSLVMGPFAQAANNLSQYVNGMPDQFCIGPTNQGAFDALNNALNSAVGTVRRGDSLFEGNFDRYCNQAIPLLNSIINESNAINSASRDFTGVVNAIRRYDQFSDQYQLDIWALTPRIEALASQLSTAVNRTDSALARALSQIETNVEAESRRFVDQLRLAEDAFRHWDTVDGKQGYDRYEEILKRVVQVMIPEFNNFLRKVPATQRIQAAVQQAQQAINQIDTGFASFPTFQLLSSDSASFPHQRYGSEDRKYAGSLTSIAVQEIASAYYRRTSKKLYIGDMQYMHGGKMGIHKSHKEGIDADVDGIEIGDVPNHDAAKALALAKEVLSSGARLVFYADQKTVTDANKWASDNGISGRLQVEDKHKGHFHLRMPWASAMEVS